jgi:hypothetical protein
MVFTGSSQMITDHGGSVSVVEATSSRTDVSGTP